MTAGVAIVPGFRTPPSRVPVPSAADILGGTAASLPNLRDRIVLIGITAIGLGDRVITPRTTRHIQTDAGVLVHAAAIESLLTGDVTAGRNAPPVILMTARGTIETAAIAARVGAFDYIAKPFKVRDLIERVRSAVTPKTAAEPSTLAAPDSMMVGVHESMVEMYKAITRVASLDVPVLVYGESGNGKELVAKAIHTFGKRADEPAAACLALDGHVASLEPFSGGVYALLMRHDGTNAGNGMHNGSNGTTLTKRSIVAIDNAGNMLWTVDLN